MIRTKKRKIEEHERRTDSSSYIFLAPTPTATKRTQQTTLIKNSRLTLAFCFSVSRILFFSPPPVLLSSFYLCSYFFTRDNQKWRHFVPLAGFEVSHQQFVTWRVQKHIRPQILINARVKERDESHVMTRRTLLAFCSSFLHTIKSCEEKEASDIRLNKYIFCVGGNETHDS